METNINTQLSPTKEKDTNLNEQTNGQNHEQAFVQTQTLEKAQTILQSEEKTCLTAENQATQKETLEKDEPKQTDNPAQEKGEPHSGVFLSTADAEEYKIYKKQKILSAVSLAISRTQGSLLNGEDTQRVCERANRLRQVAVKTPLTKLMQVKYYLGVSGVKIDCVIGGTGETISKVKVYEAKLAVKRKAQEITLVATPSLLDSCRYGEIRKEIKRVKSAIKRTPLKLEIPKQIAPTALARVARVCSETGVKFLSVPHFQGCERLRLDLTGGCELEVIGVEDFASYRRLVGAGVRRIVTDHAWEFYLEWLKECGENAFLPVGEHSVLAKKQEKTPVERDKTGQNREICAKNSLYAPNLPSADKKNNAENDYRCRLEGTQLKFL